MIKGELKMEDIEINKIEEESSSTKNWLTTLLLCWFFGFLGIHRFYAGKITTGFYFFFATIASILAMMVDVYLGAFALVWVGTAVVWDFCTIAFKEFKDCYGKVIDSSKLN